MLDPGGQPISLDYGLDSLTDIAKAMGPRQEFVAAGQRNSPGGTWRTEGIALTRYRAGQCPPRSRRPPHPAQNSGHDEVTTSIGTAWHVRGKSILNQHPIQEVKPTQEGVSRCDYRCRDRSPRLVSKQAYQHRGLRGEHDG